MGLSREEAYEILELPVGVDQDSIRTSYKRLALKWHPDKHKDSQEALTKFKLVSKSYKRLTTTENTDTMTLDNMLSLFKEVFFSRQVNSFNGSGYDSSDDDDDDDEEDLEEDVKYSNLFPDKIKLKQDWKKARDEGDITGKQLSAEEISRNAEELITEEEKEKRKAEKRRAKKKRRRDKKKQEKQENPSTELMEEKKSQKQKSKDGEQSTDRSKKTDAKGDASTSSDEASFDPNSAFFTKVVNKKKKDPRVPDSSSGRGKKDKSDEETEDLDPKTLRSRQLAIKGNEMAHLGHYNAAIELFSEAIKLDPKDFRFFGNRSYCYDRIQQYEKALKDAEKAISLAKDWPKGYFRQGRALAGLKMFPDAEQAFSQVLKLDKNCEDAVQELLRVRTHQIMEMGFTRPQAEAAIKRYGTVQAALDSLLAGVAENSLSVDREVYVSDDDDSFTPAANSRTQGASDTKMDPKNPEGLTALWVGNVLPDVTEKKLQQMFSRFGPVKSVRCLPEKYCAFVNFASKEAAGKAMVGCQGVECNGQRLLIKFPDHPITNGNDHGTITLRKNQSNINKRPILIGRKRQF
ncbi:stress-induced-phosphoprotein 1-like isoform X2 [Mya arenaria]|uniref:stress-induced-phosphoprotein 1-like isoform X2 n=1 Tax=Mya arenaria TaxID=6604 RepID=UPI0022E167C5|nr:stress-induced-phosphoprotein 1-like isoform X2 [Mya arenaria]